MQYVPRQPPEEANVSPGSPLVELAQLVVGGVLAVVVLALAVGWLVDRAVGWLPLETEERVFGALVSEVASSRPLEAEDQTRVDQLLQRLGHDRSVVVGLMEDESINAVALPGGAILVTRGLLDNASDDEVLAFVLGHELAHLEHRDGLRALGRGVILGVAIAVVGAGGSAGPFELGEVTGRLALQKFGRGQELRADAAAVARMQRAGFGTEGAVSLLERFEANEGFGSKAVAWAATHPLSAARIEAIRARR